MVNWFLRLLDRIAPVVDNHPIDCRCWLCTEEPFASRPNKAEVQQPSGPGDASDDRRARPPKRGDSGRPAA